MRSSMELYKLIAEDSRQISVVLVDDHYLIRRSIRSCLAPDPQINVVGEADESEQAISLITQTQPDVAMLDIRLGQGSGIDVGRAIKSLSSFTKILVLTAYDDIQYVRSLMKIGISGYMLKTTSPKELRKAVHDVAENRVVFSPSIIDKMVSLLGPGRNGSHPRYADAYLTNRQSDVLNYMGQGMRNREIADALGISLKTVEAHVEQILRKLGVKNRTQAVISAEGYPA